MTGSGNNPLGNIGLFGGLGEFGPAPVWSTGGKLTATIPAGMPQAPHPWWSQPMNSQTARVELTRQIIVRCAIARIVETGTFIGTTAEFFARFGVPVVTAETNAEFAQLARERLAPWPNVDLRERDSVTVLRELGGEPIDRSVPTLFYLDAHWQEHLPLRDETTLAITHFPKAVLLIDDFAVPGDAGYGFDDYGPDKRLTLDYLLQGSLASLTLYFPVMPSEQESGARRGCVVATANAELAAILDGFALLRRWRG